MDNLSLGIWMCCLLVALVTSLRLDRCELAGQLYILDVPKAELAHWLCIADFESRFNTHVIGNGNSDGSRDYGIFQISDRYWCAPPDVTPYHAFNGCNVNCTDLLSNNITAAIRCARLIRKQQGWTAWSVYEEFCNETMKLSDAQECFQPDSVELDTTEDSLVDSTTIATDIMN